MASDDLVTINLTRHLRILAVCWQIYGIICLVSALWLAAFTNTATVMFGALLNRVPDPVTMMSEFHFLYALTIVLSIICGILGVLAGVALLAGRQFGRTIALIASFLSLSSIPLGTTLGVYSLIVLIPLSVSHASEAVVETRPSKFRNQPVTM